MPPSVATEWIDQAKRDLEVARHLLAHGYFEWAAFAASQAGEKAVKATRHWLGTDINEIKVHNLESLLGTLPDLHTKPDPVLERSLILTEHNQNARYPSDKHGSKKQAPFKSYDEVAAKQTVAVAEGLQAFCWKLCADAEAFWKQR